MKRRLARNLTAALILVAGSVEAQDWPQWGGPGRDFRLPDPGLSSAWPAEGLRPLWKRPLGEGFSGIAASAGRLYTLYSQGEQEVVVAFDAATGAELWSHSYAARRPDGMRLNYGEGPHVTPLVVGQRVFTVGTSGLLLALDADSGAELWSHDLWGELGGYRLRRGYGASPLAYGETVILPVGGKGPGVIAFAQADGRPLWRSPKFDSAQSSPLLVSVDGQEQVVLFIQDEVVAVAPRDGKLLWRHEHKAFGPYNISTPVWREDGLLFVSSSYGGGSRLLRLSVAEGDSRVEEIWHNKRMGIHFTNALWIGDHVYASTGRSGVMAAAVNVVSGELAWKNRSIGRANYLQVGRRVLALEAEGRLMLADLRPDGLSIVAQTQLLESQTWTAPTLVGHTLYVRDRASILAVELPLAAAPQS